MYTPYSPHNALRIQDCYLHFVGKETEAQRGFITQVGSNKARI